MNSYSSEIGYLSDDARFSKVPTEKQMGIVDAITREAAAMMLKQGLSPEQAKQQAREKVLGNLDATGNYVLPKAATPSPAGNAPAVGTIKNGYKFNGGNPADKNSWEKI
jgi:hypothetical protein